MVSSHAGNVQNTREQGLGASHFIVLHPLAPSSLLLCRGSLGACVQDFPFAAAVAEPLLLALVFPRAVPACSPSCCRVICIPCTGGQLVKHTDTAPQRCLFSLSRDPCNGAPLVMHPRCVAAESTFSLLPGTPAVVASVVSCLCWHNLRGSYPSCGTAPFLNSFLPSLFRRLPPPCGRHILLGSRLLQLVPRWQVSRILSSLAFSPQIAL